MQKLRAAVEAGQYLADAHFIERAVERGFTIGEAVRVVLNGTVVVYRPACSCSARGRWVITGPVDPNASARTMWVALRFSGEQPVIFVTGWFDLPARSEQPERKGGE